MNHAPRLSRGRPLRGNRDTRPRVCRKGVNEIGVLLRTVDPSLLDDTALSGDTSLSLAQVVQCLRHMLNWLPQGLPTTQTIPSPGIRIGSPQPNWGSLWWRITSIGKSTLWYANTCARRFALEIRLLDLSFGRGVGGQRADPCRATHLCVYGSATEYGLK